MSDSLGRKSGNESQVTQIKTSLESAWTDFCTPLSNNNKPRELTLDKVFVDLPRWFVLSADPGNKGMYELNITVITLFEGS